MTLHSGGVSCCRQREAYHSMERGKRRNVAEILWGEQEGLARHRLYMLKGAKRQCIQPSSHGSVTVHGGLIDRSLSAT